MKKNCEKCGKEMFLEETYHLDKQDGFIWVCENEHTEEFDYEPEDNYES